MSTSDIIKDLESLKEKLEKTKSEKERAEGSYQTLMSQLKKEFGFSSIEEAENAIAQLEDEKSKKEKLLEKEYSELKESFQW